MLEAPKKKVYTEVCTEDFIVFLPKRWTVIYKKPIIKIKALKNYVKVCSPPLYQNKGTKSSVSYQYPQTPFLEDFGGYVHVMCAHLRMVGRPTALESVSTLPAQPTAPIIIGSIGRTLYFMRRSILCVTACDSEGCGQGERWRCTSRIQ